MDTRNEKSPRLSKKELTKLAVEAENLMSALSEYKKFYARLDIITQILLDQDLSGTGISMIDNFEEKNIVWKSSCIRRFELKKNAEIKDSHKVVNYRPREKARKEEHLKYIDFFKVREKKVKP